MRDDVLIRSPFKRVDVLQVDARLVVQHSTVDVFDVRTADAPRTIARLFPDHRSIAADVAVGDDQRHVVVTDGARLLRVNLDGEAVELYRDASASVARMRSINWHVSVHGDYVYFVFLGQPESFFGEVHVPSGELRRLPFRHPVGVCVDYVRRVAFCPNDEGRRSLLVGSFADEVVEAADVAVDYDFADLSPDRGRLLLSAHAMPGVQASMAWMDVAAKTLRNVGVVGAHGTWLTDDEVLFTRGEGELLFCRLADRDVESWFHVDVRPTPHGSYATAPTCSRSRRLVAWGFGSGMDVDVGLKTVVLDLARREYRLFDGWWHSKAIMEAAIDKPG
jgi:hypothetical protein